MLRLLHGTHRHEGYATKYTQSGKSLNMLVHIAWEEAHLASALGQHQ